MEYQESASNGEHATITVTERGDDFAIVDGAREYRRGQIGTKAYSCQGVDGGDCVVLDRDSQIDATNEGYRSSWLQPQTASEDLGGWTSALAAGAPTERANIGGVESSCFSTPATAPYFLDRVCIADSEGFLTLAHSHDVTIELAHAQPSADAGLLVLPATSS